MPSPATTLSHCAELVRTVDHDRWLTILYADRRDREGLAALYAFNHEVAKTRESVSEPMLGEIRLEWWRETIAGLYAGSIRKHPVAEALAAVVEARELPRADFEAVIEARRADLYDERPKTRALLLDYAEQTGGRLLLLAMHVCGGRDAPALGAARAIGRGWALTGILRALAFQAEMGRLMLPDDALEAHGITPETVFRGGFPAEARPLIADIADQARQALADGRRHRSVIAPRARPPLLLAILAEDYLNRLAQSGHDPLKVDFRRGAVTRQGKLLFAALRGRY